MSEPEVIRDKSLMRAWSRSRRCNGITLALVPTMGFLHDGHLSLVRTAKTLADLTVVSIYVNPGQFAPSEDLSTYPSDLAGDLRKLTSTGVDAVFCPTELYHSASDTDSARRRGTIYGESEAVSCLEDGGSGHKTWIRVETLEKGLCGTSRPAFFRGVATVVAKLFNIVEPDVALFGKKDYQQWRVICQMVRFESLRSLACTYAFRDKLDRHANIFLEIKQKKAALTWWIYGGADPRSRDRWPRTCGRLPRAINFLICRVSIPELRGCARGRAAADLPSRKSAAPNMAEEWM